MPRRVRGEGGIYREGKSYVAQFSYVDDNGQRHRPKVRAASRPEALAELEALRSKHTGTAPTTARRASRERVSAFLDRWMTVTVTPTKRAKTVRAYAYQVEHIKAALGHLQLSHVGREEVQAALNSLAARGLSASTVHQAKRVMHTAFEYAVDLGLLAANPARKVEVPAAHGKRTALALTGRQVSKLLEATVGSRFHALYAVTVAVGLREGEALGLRWRDLDLDALELHVLGQLQRGEFVEAKTASAKRVVALPVFAQRALLARAGAQADEAARARRLLGPTGWEDRGFVFTTQRGRPLEARNMYRSFKKEAAGAGFPDLTFHDLRHTAITLMAAGGVHQRTVMHVVGHSKASLTTEIYTQASVEMQRAAAEVMDLAIGPGKGPGLPPEGLD